MTPQVTLDKRRCQHPRRRHLLHKAPRRQQRMPKMLERVDALVDSLGKRSVHLADSALLAAHLTLMALDENANNSYLRCLPVSLDVPILWPEALRKVLLQGSSCYASCQSQVAVSDKLFDAISGR